MCTVCWDEDAECLLLFLTDWGSLKTVAEGRKEGRKEVAKARIMESLFSRLYCGREERFIRKLDKSRG